MIREAVVINTRTDHLTLDVDPIELNVLDTNPDDVDDEESKLEGMVDTIMELEAETGVEHWSWVWEDDHTKGVRINCMVCGDPELVAEMMISDEGHVCPACWDED